MSWIIVVLVVALPVVVLIAWGMWLGFAALIVKRHGLEGLEAVRHVADGFQPREWALLIPRHVLLSALAALNPARPAAPPLPSSNSRHEQEPGRRRRHPTG
jgi:hypothetical protein